MTKVNVDVDGKLKSCETEMVCTAANTEMPLDVSSASKSAQHHLNGVSSLQKEDIYFLNLLLQKFSSPEVYKSISKDQKAVFQKYVTYIVDVIGNPSSGANQLLICRLTDNAFFQSQGASLLCGVCAINNSVGREIVTVEDLDIVADKLFIESIHKGEINLTGPFLPTRSPFGDYFFEVLEVAAQQKHVETIRIRRDFF